jgi:O-antigen polymerase
LKKETYISIFLGLLIISTLINNNVFESIVYAAYYYYGIIASVIIGFTGILYLKNKHLVSINLPTPILLFSAIPIYYLLQNVFYYDHTVNIPQYLILNAILLFSYYSIFSIYTISFDSIFKLITFIACFESLYCLFQFFGWIHSNTSSFKVTGTWINPNVTAIFLAMAWPSALSHSLKENNKKVNSISLFVILSALFVLKCRTAFIGITLSTALILNYRFDCIKNIREKFIGYKIFLPLSLGLIFILSSAFYLVKSKQASTNGRSFIYKISTSIIAQKPILGWGYESFVKEYNQGQAIYFKTTNGTKEEIENASFVRSAYNELLHNAVEGGVVIVIIFLTFYSSLLFKYKQIQNVETLISYAATTSFILMSLFNFTFFALPAMCLFVLHVAMLCYSTKDVIHENLKINSVKYKYLTTLIFFSLSIYFIFSLTINAIASAKSKEATLLSTIGENKEAILIFEALKNQLSNSTEYLKNYGNALFMQKDNTSAINKYKEAICIAPDPDILLKLGFCYQQTKQYDKALEVCTLAHNIVPNRVLPLFSQMSIYMYSRDTANTIKLAKQIVKIIPKISSQETDFYKKQATILLSKLTVKQ